MSGKFTFSDDPSPAAAPETATPASGTSKFLFSAPVPNPGVTESFLRGANEAITAMAVYAPENAVMTALESVGLVKEGSPRRVTDWMNETFHLMGAESPDMTDRLARRAGSMVVENLAAVSPVYLEAKAAQGVMNPTLANFIKEQLVGYIRKAPVASLVGETVSAAGSGAGMEFAREKGGGPTAQFFGGLAGGVLPTTLTMTPTAMATKYAVRGAQTLRSKFTKEARMSAVYRAIQEELRAGLDATGEANLKAANDALTRINTARIATGQAPTDGLTIAESTGSQNLINLQHKFEKEATGSVLNDYIRRKITLAKDVLFGNAHKPEFTGIEPDVIYDASRARVDRVTADIDTRLDALRQQKADVAGALPRASDRVDLGTTLRTIRENSRDIAAASFKERADKIGLNDYDVAFPMNDLKGQLRVAMNTKGTQLVEADLPPSIRDILHLTAKKPAATPQESMPTDWSMPSTGGKVPDEDPVMLAWADVELLRRRLADDMEKAVATPGEGRYVRQLAIAKDLFDKHILGVVPDSPTPRPTFGADWAAFRNDYFNQVITRFDQGAAYKMSAAGKPSEYRMLPEKVVDAFWNSESSVRDFKKLYGDRPDAIIALRDAVLDKVRDAAVRNGEIDEKLLTTWMRKNARQLDEVPIIRDELSNVYSRVSALSAREAQLNARRTVVEKMVLTKALGKAPEDYVRSAIHNEKLMRHVVNTARRTHSERALTAAIWEEAMRQIDTPNGELPSPEKFINWARDNHRSLKIALPKEHLQNIEDIYTVLTAIRRTPLPAGTPSNTSPLAAFETFTGTNASQLSSRWWGMVQGRTSRPIVALERAITFFDKYTKRQKDALLREAMMDEKKARELRDMMITASNGAEIPAAKYRKLNGWLYSLGVASTTAEGKKESE